MSEHATPREQAGRAHVAPQKNDSVWYKAKVYSPFVGLLLLVVTATWAFTNYDKRISILEPAVADLAVRAGKTEYAVAVLQSWVPLVDLKLDLLLEHFGLTLPPKVVTPPLHEAR